MLTVLKIMGMRKVKEGEMLRVMCNLTGGNVSQHAISWLINGQVFSQQLFPRVEVVEFPMEKEGFLLSELRIRSSRDSDAGVYACRGPLRSQADFSVEVVPAGAFLALLHKHMEEKFSLKEINNSQTHKQMVAYSIFVEKFTGSEQT